MGLLNPGDCEAKWMALRGRNFAETFKSNAKLGQLPPLHTPGENSPSQRRYPGSSLCYRTATSNYLNGMSRNDIECESD